MDVDFGEIITLARNDITIDYNNIIFTTKHLSNGRTYNIRVIATNIAGSATSCTSINTNINMTMFVAATTTSKIDGKIIDGMCSVMVAHVGMVAFRATSFHSVFILFPSYISILFPF